MFTSITIFLTIFFFGVTLYAILSVFAMIIEFVGRPARLLFKGLFRI